jgi:hypothetical protein
LKANPFVAAEAAALAALGKLVQRVALVEQLVTQADAWRGLDGAAGAMTPNRIMTPMIASNRPSPRTVAHVERNHTFPNNRLAEGQSA